MKIRIFCAILVATLLAAISCSAFAQTPAPARKTSIGIMPVFDASGEVYGELFTQHMTQILSEEMQNSNLHPVLLNPGGAYTPLDTDLIKEFAQMAKVDSVLITMFQMPDKPRSGPYTLKVTAQLLDPQSGATSAMQNYTESINRQEAIVETGYSGFFSAGGSRRFDKQPLGKRSISFSKAIRQYSLNTVPTMVQLGTAQIPPLSQKSCEINFRAAYANANKKAISKSYGLIVNGKEESLWIKEGIATMTLPSGRAIVVVNVADAPYRLPIQKVYAGNTFVDCDKPERSLVLDIGPAGEAFLRWQ
ncbi:MAG: hypothetical protein JWO20_2676 [Candidatus Angelobacter sp.]|jgi:hypothetical protein|nr:hypothetical protein [Candidatus Angelobacter sp.]